ncbi:RNA-binding protein with multiple splicing-like protein [Drosera capensis]
MDEIAAYYAAAAAPPPPPPGTHHHHDPYSPPPHPIPLHHQQPPLVILTPAPSNPRVRPSAHVSLHPPTPIHSPYSQLVSISNTEEDEVRTLFVAGLPSDVKAREIYHLFREFPGYVSSNIRRRSEHGQINDNEDSGSDKRFKASAAFSRGSADPGVRSYHVPGMSNSAYSMIGYPSTQSRLSYDTRIIAQTSSVKPSTHSSPHAPQNNPPCPTIFVANLGPVCTERELTQIFSRTLLHLQKL